MKKFSFNLNYLIKLCTFAASNDAGHNHEHHNHDHEHDHHHHSHDNHGPEDDHSGRIRY